MFRLFLYLVVVIFVLLTVGLGLVNFGSRDFAPGLDMGYSANLMPRLGAALVASAHQAIAIMATAAIIIGRFIASAVAGLFRAIDSLLASGPVSPAPRPPAALLPLPAPVTPSPPAYVPAPAGPGFIATFFSGCLNGFLLVLSVRTLLYAAGWYLETYKVLWPGGPQSLSLPKLDYRNEKASGWFILLLHLFCLTGGIVFLFSGGFAGYAGGILGFISGTVLPIVPRGIFLGLRLFDFDPDRARARLRPLLTEEGEIVRLSIRRTDRSIDAATFRKDYQGIQAGADLSAIDLLDLAAIAGALRIIDQLPADADLLERYLFQRAPDWRQQAADAAAAGAQQSQEPDQSAKAMSRADALEILDLKEGAPRNAIEDTYKRLMKQVHPDRGGSNFFAKQLNEARKVLLG